MSRWQRVHRVAGFDTVFVWYVRGLIARNFAGVLLREGSAFPRSGGYVAVANHHSWWDGFIPYYVHHTARAPQPFALMMSDPELQRFPYFRFGGVFSVDAASPRTARDAIMYAGSLARDGAAVWIFPDGILRPPSTPLRFTSGFVHAARDARAPIVPVAMRFVMLERERPDVFIAVGDAIAPEPRDAQKRSQSAVEALLTAIDADIASGNRSKYRTVLTGRKGVDERVALPRR